MPLNLRCSVQQAALNVLGDWLRTQTELDGVLVRDRWPTPGQDLPENGAITLLMVGKPQDLWTGEQLESSTPIEGTTKTDTVWTVNARRQDLQVDVWATDDVLRDHLVDVWDELSHRGPLHTLGSGDPVSDGLILALNEERDGHAGFASLTFDAVAPNDTPDARMQREYRATAAGYLDVRLKIKARTPRIARAILKQTLNGGDFPDLTVTEAS